MTHRNDRDSAAFAEQFTLSREAYVEKLDFLNWFRCFHIIKDVLEIAPRTVLEVGAGDGFIRRIVAPEVADYKVVDINERLLPDYVLDLKAYTDGLKERFECAIAADVLEHIEFSEFELCVYNITKYLKPGGHFLVTIPYRRSYFLFMTPTYRPHVVAVPTGFLNFGAFYRRFIKRKIWIDPHHCWEIGDGHVKRADVEQAFRKVGFEIRKRKTLLYVDYWVLRKAGGGAGAG